MRRDRFALVFAGFVMGVLAHAGVTTLLSRGEAGSPAATAPSLATGAAPAPAAAPVPGARAAAAAPPDAPSAAAPGPERAPPVPPARPPAPSSATAPPGPPPAPGAPPAAAPSGAAPSAAAPSPPAAAEAAASPAARDTAAASPGGPTADQALAAFRDLVRKGAAAFGKQGPVSDLFRALDEDAFAILGELVRDTQSPANRALACLILEDLRDPRGIPLLEGVLGDPDLLVARAASHALALIGTPAAVPGLGRCQNEIEDWAVRLNGAYGLARLGEQSGRDYLIEQLHAGQRENSLLALFVVGLMADIGAPEFSRELRGLIGATGWDPGLRLAGIQCSEKARDGEALPLLEAVVADPAAPDSVREAAKRAINAIRGETVYPVE